MKSSGIPIIILTLIFFSFEAKAEWVLAKYTFTFSPDVSQTEACSKAEKRAKIKALKSVIGETISSEDSMICTEIKDQAKCYLNRHTWSGIDGLVVGTRNRTEIVRPSIDGYRKCEVTLDVNVSVGKGNSDPSFDLGVKLNHRTFREGDSFKIRLSPTQPMYINVFQFLPYIGKDEQVTRIFPNPFDKNQFFKKAGSVPTKKGEKEYRIFVNFPED